MKRNDIPASSLFQSIVDKAKELFLSGCYFTVEDLNASLGQNCAIEVILQLKRQGVNIQSMKRGRNTFRINSVILLQSPL